MPDAVWTEGDTTYTLVGLRAVGRTVATRATVVADQMEARAAGAASALTDLRGPVAPVLHDLAVRTIADQAVLVGMLRRAAAVCATFPEAPAATSGPAVPLVAPIDGRPGSGGDVDALRAYADSAPAWDDAVRQATIAVDLTEVTITKVVRTSRPAPVPVPAPPPGTPEPPPVVTVSPPEPVDPRTLITLPEPSDEAAAVTARSESGSRLAAAAARAFGEADSGTFASWWARLQLDAALADARTDHGVSQEDVARELQELWLERAEARGGVDFATWDPTADTDEIRDTIIAVYEYYGELYLEDPNLLWAGMANLVGPSLAAGFLDVGDVEDIVRQIGDALDRLPGPVRDALPPEIQQLLELEDLTEEDLRFFETTVLTMEKDVYRDQAVMHEAYLTGGLPAVRELLDAGIIDDATYQGWVDIADGAATGDRSLLEQGNEQLLRREQFDILADSYDAMHDRPLGPAFTYAMTLVGQPSIPGASTYAEFDPLTFSFSTPGPEELGVHVDVDIPVIDVGFGFGIGGDNPTQVDVTVTTPLPGGNLADRDARWDFIAGDTLPTYLELARTDPDGLRALIESSMDDRVDDERILERLDDVLLGLLDWDVDVDQ